MGHSVAQNPVARSPVANHQRPHRMHQKMRWWHLARRLRMAHVSRGHQLPPVEMTDSQSARIVQIELVESPRRLRWLATHPVTASRCRRFLLRRLVLRPAAKSPRRQMVWALLPAAHRFEANRLPLMPAADAFPGPAGAMLSDPAASRNKADQSSSTTIHSNHCLASFAPMRPIVALTFHWKLHWAKRLVDRSWLSHPNPGAGGIGQPRAMMPH